MIYNTILYYTILWCAILLCYNIPPARRRWAPPHPESGLRLCCTYAYEPQCPPPRPATSESVDKLRVWKRRTTAGHSNYFVLGAGGGQLWVAYARPLQTWNKCWDQQASAIISLVLIIYIYVYIIYKIHMYHDTSTSSTGKKGSRKLSRSLTRVAPLAAITARRWRRPETLGRRHLSNATRLKRYHLFSTALLVEANLCCCIIHNFWKTHMC